MSSWNVSTGQLGLFNSLNDEPDSPQAIGQATCHLCAPAGGVYICTATIWMYFQADTVACAEKMENVSDHCCSLDRQTASIEWGHVCIVYTDQAIHEPT